MATPAYGSFTTADCRLLLFALRPVLFYPLIVAARFMSCCRALFVQHVDPS